jgi:hypothetical protein
LSVSLTLKICRKSTSAHPAASREKGNHRDSPEEKIKAGQLITRRTTPVLPRRDAQAAANGITESAVEDAQNDAASAHSPRTRGAQSLVRRSAPRHAAPWFGPLLVASAVTVAMVFALVIITIALK